MLTHETPTRGSPAYANRHLTIVWLFVCCILAAGYHLYIVAKTLAPLRDGSAWSVVFPDFMVFYAAGPALHSGGLKLVFDARAFTTFQSAFFHAMLDGPIRFERPWLYPPTSLMLALPLALLPFVTSALIVQASGMIALWLALGRRTLATLALLSSSAFCLTFLAGQNVALSAACMIGGVRLLDRAPIWAGILFALLTLKPHMFILVPIALIAARAWRALAACVVTASALVGLSLIAFGVDGWRWWLQAGNGPSRMLSSSMIDNYGIQMGSVLASVRIAGGSTTLAWSAQLIAAAVAAAATYAVFARRDHSSDGYCVARRAMALTAATLLAVPYWMNYDLLIPCAAIGLTAMQRLTRGGIQTLRNGEALTWTMVWLLPLSMLMINTIGLPIAPLVVGGALAIASAYGERIGTSEALINRAALSVWHGVSRANVN